MLASKSFPHKRYHDQLAQYIGLIGSEAIGLRNLELLIVVNSKPLEPALALNP